MSGGGTTLRIKASCLKPIKSAPMYCGLSLAYNMAACNKLPAACPRDDWTLLFVLLSLYYYRGSRLYGHIIRSRVRVRAQSVIHSGIAILLFRFTTLSIMSRRDGPRALFRRTGVMDGSESMYYKGRLSECL